MPFRVDRIRRRGLASRAWFHVLLLGLLIPGQARCSPAPTTARPHVYIILVDGLDASLVNDQLTPVLWQLTHGGGDRATFYPRARAAMPTVTSTNHVSIMTAAYPAAHGVVGNVMWDRVPGHPPASSEQAGNLEVETLFTVIETEQPELRTAALFGKSRLVELFDEVPGRQKRPDILWGDTASETEPIDRHAGFASDQRTMDEVLRTVAAQSPDLMFVGLPDVDRTSHLFGPGSAEARRAALEADREIGRLLDLVKRRGEWNRTVLMITADHGFQSVQPDRTRPYPLLFFGRQLLQGDFRDVQPVSNGAVEFLLLPGVPPGTLDGATGQRLKTLRALALAQPEIAEAWYRLPNPSDGGEAFTLPHVHPEWRLNHPRVGELVLVARPNYTFADPYSPHSFGLSGDHGGPGQSSIPIIITGGYPTVRSQVVVADGTSPQAENPDLGATSAWLLGIRMPRTVTGDAVPHELAGRILREAFD